jgi:hypothetical protein
MTRPKIIGYLTGCGELNRPDQRRLAADANLESGIDSITMDPTDPIVDALKHVVNRAGYRVMLDASRCRPYDHQGYVTGMGSAYFHADPGMGLQVAVMVATQPLVRKGYTHRYLETCQFTSRGKWIDCKIGDVFVFNGDYYHAWIANCRWALATHSIRRVRPRSRQVTPNNTSIVLL